MKIYMMPSGWDRELVMKTTFRSAADKLCLITAKVKEGHSYSESDKLTKKINEELVKELSKFTKVEVLPVDYLDLKNVIVQFNNYIKKNKEHEITINISAGSKMLAATLMLAALLNNIPLQYSVAKNHNKEIMELISNGQNYHNGFTEIVTIPSIPVKINFSVKENNLLKLFKNKKSVSVKDFVVGYTGNDENRKRAEFHYLIKKLESDGILVIKTTTKKTVVQLTQYGDIVLKM